LEPSAVDTDLSGPRPGERRLRALVHADVVGYSRLIGMNDASTVRRLRTLRRGLIDPAVRTFRGRIVNTAGDSMISGLTMSISTARQAAPARTRSSGAPRRNYIAG
jgi:class 3 adenylate cyclase